MSERLLVEEARRRKEIFSNLNKYLKIIEDVVKTMDSNAEVYLFGSVAEGKYLLSSDIDILIVTNVKPGTVLAELWKRGIEDPFEVHVVDKELFEAYRKRGKLIKIGDFINESKKRSSFQKP